MSFMRVLRPAVAACAIAALTVPGFAQQKDIVDTAVAAGDFKTLAKALEAAGLVDTLKGAGPFTVFAPTDEAFAKIPKEKLEELLKPENKEKLAGLLKYHVVSGKVTAEAAKGLDGKEATSVQGEPIKISVKDGKVHVNKAEVVKADIEASNGVIHVIDRVIMPPSVKAEKEHDHKDHDKKDKM